MENKFSVLKKYFGYDEFRQGQEFLIDNILKGKNVVAVMPTGAGKSMCFQIPAILLEGITIVVSPLISLMKDQVFSLNQAGVKAAYINSSLTANQCVKVLENAKNGLYKIIYVAPERLLADSFIYFANSVNISMVTVDEAHCISQWGQDFRPSYTRIKDFIDSLSSRPIISCFTATATKNVRDDIINQFQLKDFEILVTGFDRENLYFEVEKPKDKKSSLLKFLENKKEQSGVIYCSTRKDVDSVSNFLMDNGYLAKPYHAGLSDYDRHKNQDDFIFDKINIIVATNAFGMGIDKSNVTYVVHYNMPKDLESYYQEAGRAGRDGSQSVCLLFYSRKDIQTNLYLIDIGQSSEDIDPETMKLIKNADRARLKQMIEYCNTTNCLRGHILKYFGESIPDCGNCGSCNSEYVVKDITIEAQKILSCIVRVNERYGVNKIIDILRGSKNKGVLSLNLDKISTYGILAIPKEEIIEIINFLEYNDYVYFTNDEYAVLKLGTNSDKVLKQREKIEMKVNLSQEKESKAVVVKNKKFSQPVDEKLFNILKEVRLKISEKENVPAFIIFHNSVLIHMCMVLPTNEEEFLNVSGVGDVKSKKYGKYFIEAIKNYLDEKSSHINLSGDSILKIDIPDELVTIGVITDLINCYLIQKNLKKISSKTLLKWLEDSGYVIVKNNQYIINKSGEKIGLSIKESISSKGIIYHQLMSSKESSTFIIDSMEQFLE